MKKLLYKAYNDIETNKAKTESMSKKYKYILLIMKLHDSTIKLIFQKEKNFLVEIVSSV